MEEVGEELIIMSTFAESDGLPIAEEILGLPGDGRIGEDDISSVSDSNGGPYGSQYSGQQFSNGSSGTGKRGLPKLREILRRQKPDSEVIHFYLAQIIQINYNLVNTCVFNLTCGQ